MTADDLITLEATATRAWAAAEEERHGNWLLRANHGYTKRANSAYVIGNVDTGEIPEIRDWYAQRDLPLIIREISLWSNPDLGAWLAGNSFRRFDETLVMTGPVSPGAPTISIVAPDVWIASYAAFEGGTKGNQEHHLALINRITTPVAPVLLFANGEPVACGLAVADGDWVGLFDIATSPHHRRNGYGLALMQGLSAWGAEQGAQRTYLQVLASNAPAISLYQRLGYTEAYRNWYWAET